MQVLIMKSLVDPSLTHGFLMISSSAKKKGQRREEGKTENKVYLN